MSTAARGSNARSKAHRGFGARDPHNITRLKDQTKVQTHVNRVKAAKTLTLKRRALDEMAFYPAHDKRTESPEYHKVHVDLTVTRDLPCLVCGVRKSTLDDPGENPYGAKQMETHHHMIEWALANAVDVAKFNKIVRPHLALRHPQVRDYRQDMSVDQVKAWVDHSPDNLWVLCDVHHRAKFLGIHEITYPIWCPMDLMMDDFEAYVRSQVAIVARAKSKGRSAAKRTPKANGKARRTGARSHASA